MARRRKKAAPAPRFRRLVSPEALEGRAAPGGFLEVLLGAPLVSPLLGSAWADGNPLGADELPGLASRNKDRLTALAELRQDPFAMDRVLGDVRSLLDIASADAVMNDAYLQTAQARIGKVADALWTSDAAALSSRQFLSDLWWVDELFTSLARGGKLAPSGLGGMSTLDEGGPPNLPPTAVGDIYWTPHDWPLYIEPRGVLMNDYDPNGDILSTSLVSGPSHAASFTLGSDGSFSYTPVYHYVGEDSFVYRASDGQYTDDAAVTIDVTNAPPTAQDDSYSIKHDTLLSVPAPGVKYNDAYDPDGDPLTAVLVTGPAHAAPGGFQLNSDGSFDYTPAYHYVGNDSFQYKVTDGIADSNTATATIEVWNIAPIAVDDGPYEAFPYVPLVVEAPGVLGNDYDPDGDYPLTAVLASAPAHGTLEYFRADGSFKYLCDPDYADDVTFTYYANDGLTNSLSPATVTIHDPPTVNLTICDGRFGPAIAENLEDTRGAFTIANLNDTDGDHIRDDIDNHVVGSDSEWGLNEGDLMALLVSKPVPDRGGGVILDVGYNVKLWEDSNKITEIPADSYGEIYIPTSQLPKIVYVEMAQPSIAWISAYYTPPGEQVTGRDDVKATALWLNQTAVEHDTHDANFVRNEFADMTNPPDGAIGNIGGTGLRPLSPTMRGFANAIVIQFTVEPQGVQLPPEVRVDLARRTSSVRWYWKNGGLLEGYPQLEDWPEPPDYADDDPNELDESDSPTTSGHVYSFDPPGLPQVILGDTRIDEAQYLLNGAEFARIDINRDPAGNGRHESRASDFYYWHSILHVKKNANGDWQRTTGDQTEVHGSNCVEPGIFLP